MKRDGEFLVTLFRLRALLLIIIGGASVAALVALALQYPADWSGGLLLPAIVVLTLPAAFAYVRHPYMAIAVVIAPLPGILWTEIMVGPGARLLGLSYPVAVALSLFLAGNINEGLLRDKNPVRAAIDALSELIAPAAWTAAISIAVLAIWFFYAEEFAVSAGLEILFAGISALTVAPLACAGFGYSETFLEHLSRRRERRGRVMESMAKISQPAWGASFAGIALVFAVLGWFGSINFLQGAEGVSNSLLWAGSAFILFVGLYAAEGTWRHALALFAAIVAALECGLWGFAEIGASVSPADWLRFMALLAMGVLGGLMQFGRAQRHVQSGEEMQTARLRALEETGMAIFFAGIAVLCGLLPMIFFFPEWPVFFVTAIAAATAAGIFAPALAALIYALVPRRKTLEEVFGKR